MNTKTPINITFKSLRILLYVGVSMAIMIVGIHYYAGVLSWYWIFKWFDIMMHILGGVLVGYFSIFTMLFIDYFRKKQIYDPQILIEGQFARQMHSTKLNDLDFKSNSITKEYSKSKFVFVGILGGLIVGILWELLEYAFGLSGLGVDRRIDTISDLLNDVIGAIIISITLYSYYSNKYISNTTTNKQ